jgi:hypothetical protein
MSQSKSVRPFAPRSSHRLRDAPAHQRTPVEHAFGGEAEVLHIFDEDGVAVFHRGSRFAFGHFALAARLEENGEMDPDRFLPAEGAHNVDVQREGAQPFRAAHDVRDLHFVVIHDGGEMIGRQAVGFEDDVVVELFEFSVVMSPRR